MTEQERAAALADEIKRKNGLHFAANGYRLDGEDYTLVLSALSLLAATPAATLPPIEREGSREYLPLPGGWEIQTKGDGSSYRLCDTKTGERLNILGGDGPTAQDFVTRMAREVRVASLLAATPAAPSEVRERVAKASKTHALIRTSPKGEMFLGTCTLCGTPNLPMRAAIEPCPNQLGLSQDEALIDVLAATTADPDQEYDDRDMAEVGRALMAAIETYASTDNPDDPLFRWHPAQCPSEIVGDLIEMVNQARATAVLRTPASDGDREILWRVEQAMIAADRDPEKEVNYAGLARAALSAIRPGDRLPAGVVVPEEPTEAMEEAFHNAMEVDFEVQRQRCLKEGIAWKSLFYIVWCAAIAAAKDVA